ncbi:MAG: DoxX family membrane protein [Simkaniaceae bacterium]|nr:DoxX family membrane protein [Simkaniaceae bacterium]
MIDRITYAFGRISMSALFLVRGLNQIFDWRVADQEIAMALMDWKGTLDGIEIGHRAFDLAYQYTFVLIGCAILGELVGALCLLFGVKLRLGISLLILVWIPVVIFQHPFWLLSGVQREQELMGFLLNGAVLGGLSSLLSGAILRKNSHRQMIHFRGNQ